MATKKKILYIVEAMGGGVFTYIVDTKQQWDVKGTVAMRKISELWSVGWSFSFLLLQTGV